MLLLSGGKKRHRLLERLVDEVELLTFGYTLYPEEVSLMARAEPKEIALTENFRFILQELGPEGTARALEG